MGLKEFIWDLFPHFYYQYDTYKDQEGKGLLQRYIEEMGTTLDEEVMIYLKENSNKYYLNNIQPLEVEDNLVDTLARVLGNPPTLFDGDEYRKLLQYISSIYKIKGSKLSYTLFLNLLGFEVDIVEYDPDDTQDIQMNFGFYDEVDFLYDDNGEYDVVAADFYNTCITCSEYTLLLSQIGDIPLTDEIISKISDIIYLVEPINAKLRNIILSIPDFTDSVKYCIKQDIIIQTLREFQYDQLDLLYDDNDTYDNDSVDNITPIYLDCDGSQLLQGIGYWDIGGSNVVQ